MASLDEIREHLRIKSTESIPTEPISYEQYEMWNVLKSPQTETVEGLNILEKDKSHVADTLQCPKCGEYYLHHISVETFSRYEDYDSGDHIKLIEDKSFGWTCLNVIPPEHSTDSNMKNNPSGRRSGVSITFVCECCHGVVKLGIGQDRGHSQLTWRYHK